jgi:hypothetical protein
MDMDDRRLRWGAILLVIIVLGLAWWAGWFGGARTATTTVPIPPAISGAGNQTTPTAPAK